MPPKGQARRPQIFISHRHADEDVAGALVEFLGAAFHLESESIRCTSAQPFRLSPGAPVRDSLREDIGSAAVVLGVLTPQSRESSYVQFELGAAWGRGIPCFPLLAKGATRADIPGPFADLHFLELSDEGDCQQLLEGLRSVAGLRRRKGFEAQAAKKASELALRAGRRDLPGIRITRPAHGQAIHGRDFPVEGQFDRLPEGSFRVFLTNANETRIWPQKRVVFHPHSGTWEAKASLLDQPAHEAYLMVAEVGEMGRLLYDYYTEVGEAKDIRDYLLDNNPGGRHTTYRGRT